MENIGDTVDKLVVSVHELESKMQAMIDAQTYGVSWDPNNVTAQLTRVGNMALHKSLPIQSKMKGCIAQLISGSKKIIYYLNPSDWRLELMVRQQY